MRGDRWKYTIQAYQGNALVLETGHATEASRDIEMQAFKARMKRGDFSHIEISTHVEPYGTQRLIHQMIRD